MKTTTNFEFKLSPEWLFREPIDFEYNKYVLLSYIQKCEKNFDEFKLYPDFIELSLHLVNLQSIAKERVLMFTDKKFSSYDDEILLKDLKTKRLKDLNKVEEQELTKTIQFSGPKLFDAFNIGKTIWSLAFESIEFQVKNKENLHKNRGIFLFTIKDKLHIYEYFVNEIKRNDSTYFTLKVTKKYVGTEPKSNVYDILRRKSRSKNPINFDELPTFDVDSNQEYPMLETMVPMIKRKILSILYSNLNSQNHDR